LDILQAILIPTLINFQ